MKSVQDVLSVLEDSGFERLPKPLTVAGTEFNFDATARGRHPSHDLVLVATDQFPRLRLQRLIAGLARSLDLAASRRPMSLVLMGEIAASDRIELERYARVLPIGSVTPDVAEIEEAVAVLLPLKLPAAELVHGSDPVNEVMAALGPVNATTAHIALVKAAFDGPDAVREALRRYVNEGAGWADDAEDDDE
jgi:hypothetical protein